MALDSLSSGRYTSFTFDNRRFGKLLSTKKVEFGTGKTHQFNAYLTDILEEHSQKYGKRSIIVVGKPWEIVEDDRVPVFAFNNEGINHSPTDLYQWSVRCLHT
jgi:hypothetical protein